MRIKDIKAGGWVRTKTTKWPELYRVTEFRYDRSVVNGYIFHFQGVDCGLMFERNEFKYSENVGDLIKKDEQILERDGEFIICKGYSRDEFIKLCEEEKE